MADEEQQANKSQNEDINEVFGKIAFPEEKFTDEGFKEGLVKGQKEGKIDGYHLGYHKGITLGNEIGFYKGLVKFYMENPDAIEFQKQEKIKTILIKLDNLLEKFPKDNCETLDFSTCILDVRSCYKKLASLLKFKKKYLFDSDTFLEKF